MPSYWKEDIPKKAKKPGKIPYQSKAMQALNAKYSKVLDEIDQERDPVCQGCGKPEFEHSHSIPRNYNCYAYFLKKKNIWRLCRDCHVAYEAGRVWTLACGEKIMQNIWKLDEQYYMQKSEQLRKRLSEYREKNWLALSNNTLTLPEWTKDYE